MVSSLFVLIAINNFEAGISPLLPFYSGGECLAESNREAFEICLTVKIRL